MVRDATNTMSLEAIEGQLLEPSEAAEEGVPLFVAHWHLFVPSFVIAVLYLLIWYLASISQISSHYSVRLVIVLFAVVVPLILAWAFLRFETIKLQVNPDRLIYHPGWPASVPLDLSLSDISEVKTRKGVLGNLFGGGDVRITTTEGKTAEIKTLREPANASAAILEAKRKTA